MFKKFFLAALAAAIATPAVAADASVESGALRIDWTRSGQATLVLNGKALSPAAEFRVLDGEGGKPYRLECSEVRSGADRVSAVYADPAAGVSLTLDAGRENGLIRLDFKLRNNSGKRILPELHIFFPLPEKASIWFDGFEDRRISGGTMIRRNTLHNTFPVMAAFSETAGIAYGFCPEQPVSFFENLCRKGTFGQKIRLVVFPGGEAAVRQVIYGFVPDYGTDRAVERYFRHFPAAAAPTEGIDPRMTRGCEGCQETRNDKADYT